MSYLDKSLWAALIGPPVTLAERQADEADLAALAHWQLNYQPPTPPYFWLGAEAERYA